MSSVTVQPKVDASGHVLIPLTAERKRQLAAEVAHGMVGLLRDDLMARGREGMARGEALAAQGEALKQVAEQKRAEAKQHATEAAEHSVKAAEHEAKLAQLRAQKAQIIKIVSAQILIGVFHGQKKIPAPLSLEIFAKYFSNTPDAISIEQDPATKKPIYETKTTVPFAQYVEANPDKLTNCDFRIFNEKISDMGHVSMALSSPSCSINAVWISSKVSEETKAYLEKAQRMRSEAILHGETAVPLTINYV